MTDKPILFKAEMVRAILEGRKTMTRRVIESVRVFARPDRPAWTLKGEHMQRALQNADRWRSLGDNSWFWESDAFPHQAPALRTGWMANIGYAVGDTLWVREALVPYDSGFDYAAGGDECLELADFNEVQVDFWNRMAFKKGDPMVAPNVPSIHMPRWASRITLRVTAVKVERLQDISEADCLAEGIKKIGDGWFEAPTNEIPPYVSSSIWCFERLWESINGAGSWAANPFVAAYSFERVM